MSTFAQLAALPGVGVNMLLEVSTDRFSTVTYRYSLASVLVGANQYEGRIVSMGKLSRGFGIDGLYAAGTVGMELDNADGALDWLTSATTVASTVLKSRFRLTMMLFDPADPTDTATKVLGVFVCLNYPSRDDVKVTLTLADDALGDLAEFRTRPTYGAWWGTPAPGYDYLIDHTRQVQLAFGGEVPCVRFLRGPAGTTSMPLALYATTQLDNVTTPPTFWVSVLTFASGFSIGPNPGSSSGAFLFEVNTSATITVDGWSFRIHYVTVNTDEWWKHPPLAEHLRQLNLTQSRTIGVPTGGTITYSGSSADEILDAVGPIVATCWPCSSRSYRAVDTSQSYDGIGFGVTGSDVVYDLLAHYAKVPAADIDTSTFDEVRDAWPGARVQGVISEDVSSRATVNGEDAAILQTGRLRGVLRDVCRSTMMDLAAGWDGDLRLSGATATFTSIVAGMAGTLPVLDEELCEAGSVTVRTPSPGERWAPYNRLYLSEPGRTIGPFDNSDNITEWGREVVRHLDAPWAQAFGSPAVGVGFSAGEPGWARLAGQVPLESKVRPILSFRYKLAAALELELGDYFVMSVTRGGNSFTDTHTAAIWRVDAITAHCLTGYVDIVAVWSSDIITEMAYLLDDETLHVITDSSTFAGDPEVESANPAIIFSAGDLAAAGVAAGDILVIEDASEAEAEFKRNRGLWIQSVDSATQVTIDDGDLDFGGTIVITTWKIVRGKTRLPTSGGSYTSGSYMYGAASRNAEYSSTETANRFKAG